MPDTDSTMKHHWSPLIDGERRVHLVKRGKRPVRLTLLRGTLKSLDAYARQEGLSRHKAARRIIELFFERG
jgi:hypothetical protein